MSIQRFRRILKRLRQQGYVHHHWPVVIRDKGAANRTAARLREGGFTVRIIRSPPSTTDQGGYVIMRRGGK
jgi:7-keto-8-aminopelargonate synthetase-like enzyme